jgi:hypothetical protein
MLKKPDHYKRALITVLALGIIIVLIDIMTYLEYCPLPEGP